jgi:hypothetical protein
MRVNAHMNDGSERHDVKTKRAGIKRVGLMGACVRVCVCVFILIILYEYFIFFTPGKK